MAIPLEQILANKARRMQRLEEIEREEERAWHKQQQQVLQQEQQPVKKLRLRSEQKDDDDSGAEIHELLELFDEEYQKRFEHIRERLLIARQVGDKDEILKCMEEITEMIEALLKPENTYKEGCASRVTRTLKRIFSCFMTALLAYSLPSGHYVDTTLKAGLMVSALGFAFLAVDTGLDLGMEKEQVLQRLQTKANELSKKIKFLQTLHKSGQLDLSTREVKDNLKLDFGRSVRVRKSSGKIARKSSGKIARKSSGKVARKSSGKVARKSTRKVARKSTRKVARK